MKSLKHYLSYGLAILFLSLTTGNAKAQVRSPYSNSIIQKQVDSIYNNMSMNEKIAQLHGIRSKELIVDRKLSIEKCKELIPYGIGHISQFACVLDLNADELRDFVRDLQNYLIHHTRQGIPAIFHEEAITGFAARGATTYPQQIGMACSWNPNLLEKKSEYTAETMRECGATMALSPMVDVIKTQHFNRVEESYGEDAYLVSTMALAFVKGMHTKQINHGVETTTKHFLGYGGGCECSKKELFEEILMPHEVCIKLGNNKSIMTGYHSYQGTPAVSDRFFLQDILRNYLQYDGLIISDYGATAKKWQNKTDKLLKERAMAAFNAGNDLELCNEECYHFLPELIAEGKVSKRDFEAAVKRNLIMKARLGLLNRKQPLVKKGKLEFDPPKGRELAYELASQSIVLLKNKGILPLKDTKKSIALVGPNANTFWCMLGDYSYQSMYAFWESGKVSPNDPKIYTLKECLEQKCKQLTINYERGCDWSSKHETQIDHKTQGDPRAQHLKMMLLSTSDKTDWKRAMEIAKENEIIIAAMGENPTLCGEGRERKGIRLPGDQERFVNQLIATGKPVILVLFGGRAQVLNEYTLTHTAAILQAWYPGEEGANAVTDILLGKVNPSAKLCVSYPANESKEKICYNNLKENNRIAFPFGHGLSYTQFSYSKLSLPQKVNSKESEIECSFKIKNRGTRAGTEITQLYLSPAEKDLPMRRIQLKGFKRVKLEAKQESKVTFKLPMQLFACYQDNQWKILPGKYKIKVGSSSKEILLEQEIEIEGEVQTFKSRTDFFSKAIVSH